MRRLTVRRYYDSGRFQFTHPVWGATRRECYRWCRLLCFNSRTPCGVRQPPRSSSRRIRSFQFTHPVWGATSPDIRRQYYALVSIHAPRVGCDASRLSRRTSWRSFNSRTPCGVRRRCVLSLLGWGCFNSRTPCGVRQFPTMFNDLVDLFQFTHPVWGATYVALFLAGQLSFNSRTPCGVRRLTPSDEIQSMLVSIHAPRVGCDGLPLRLLIA